MANRREFLQGTLAVSALPLVGGFAPLGTKAEGLALYKAVYDERFATSRAFAGEMKARGVAVHAIKGDVTDLWYRDLHKVWSSRKAPIAGLVTGASLFCLDQLARDYQMRVAYSAEHRAAKVETIADALAAAAAAPAGAPSIQKRSVADTGSLLYSFIIAPAKREPLYA